MIETYIANFYISLYIPVIQMLAFNLLHVRILRTHHCVNTHFKAFKSRRSFKYVLCPCNYAQQVVTSFSNKIQSEYNGVNIYAIRRISITDIEPNLEYRLGLMMENGIRTHSIQHTIRIHRHVSNITQVRSYGWFVCCVSNISLVI